MNKWRRNLRRIKLSVVHVFPYLLSILVLHRLIFIYFNSKCHKHKIRIGKKIRRDVLKGILCPHHCMLMGFLLLSTMWLSILHSNILYWRWICYLPMWFIPGKKFWLSEISNMLSLLPFDPTLVAHTVNVNSSSIARRFEVGHHIPPETFFFRPDPSQILQMIRLRVFSLVVLGTLFQTQTLFCLFPS